MHLMFFIEIAKPSRLERTLILIAQLIFWNYYFLLYVFAPKTAHKMIHYFEEEAVRSYTSYLALIENGEAENIAAPQLAIDYYRMKDDARLTDLIVRVRADEQRHADANLAWASNDAEDQGKIDRTTIQQMHRWSEHASSEPAGTIKKQAAP
jgi:ubiquinol oxidase